MNGLTQVRKSAKKRILGMMRNLLASRGYTLLHNRDRAARATMEGAVRAIAKRHHSLNTVIDVGASDGVWSQMLMEYYLSSQYLLIEALPFHESALRKFCNHNKNAQFLLAAAGETPGEIFFDTSEPLGGQASYSQYPSDCIKVPVTTIDREVLSRSLKPPYLIKLDTHGFEVPILKGAINTLPDTEVIVMECYNFKVSPEGLLFFEMCDYLSRVGFRCIDLVDPSHRPHDDAFWQMDLCFVKKNRAEFSYSQYT